MKTQNLTYLLVFFLLLSLGWAVFNQSKSIQLQKELAETKAFQSSIDGQMAVQQELMHIDSMLIDGNYREALEAYKTQFSELKAEETTEVQLRMALAENLLNLKPSIASGATEEELIQEVDSSQILNVDADAQLKKYDSLNFLLEKTQVQLSRIKRQLLQRSFGEYLTFSSSKGSKMHYVGQVKEHKANGHGLALLSTGSRYEGEWKDNLRHGEGTFYWADGEYYIGAYVKDKREGWGTYYWPNGEKYVGEWKNDKRFGKGVFYGKDGKIIANGVWEEDKLVAMTDRK